MFSTGKCLGKAGAWDSGLHLVLCHPTPTSIPTPSPPVPRTVPLSPHLPTSDASFGLVGNPDAAACHSLGRPAE